MLSTSVFVTHAWRFLLHSHSYLHWLMICGQLHFESFSLKSMDVSHSEIRNANKTWFSSVKCQVLNCRFVKSQVVCLTGAYSSRCSSSEITMLVLTVQIMAVPKYDYMFSSITPPLPLNDAVYVLIKWMCKCNLCTISMWLQWLVYSWEIRIVYLYHMGF